MPEKNDYYINNPLIHKNRRLSLAKSSWISSFSCEDIRPLIICRGPIRKEAIDVFREMGIDHIGILLSEKDSIVYTYALSPEIRIINDPDHIHRVPDYSGASKEERDQRIQHIIGIANENGYNAVFAGYGFMAEDDVMVKAVEDAGLIFIGPCANTIKRAGLKDQAKKTALSVGASVTPGINNAAIRTLLSQYQDINSLKDLVAKESLPVKTDILDKRTIPLEDKAQAILEASYNKGIDLFTIDDLCQQLKLAAVELFKQYPQHRIRFKAIGGGGGKGQRLLASPQSYNNNNLDDGIEQAVAKTPELVREVLNEVKAAGVGDNKNILLEINVETTRHIEIQVIGNGEWAISLGGRDCSLQMHEQKLVEISLIQETLKEAIEQAKASDSSEELDTLTKELATLRQMESDATRFSEAVALDSVSTFECIVNGDQHYFMEMNTRIQVEHRVTELCYSLEFSNPENPADYFVVESLIEAMVLLARHKKSLPKPERLLRKNFSIEARLNASNQALLPHPGGVIESWSNPINGEIRDDQGICLHNPDTDVFMKYTLTGAYDSNIALVVTYGQDRLHSYERLAEIIRVKKMTGKNLATNIEFHYGLIRWFLGQNVNARPTTQFILPYLAAVGSLKSAADQIDLSYAYNKIRNDYLKTYADNPEAQEAAANAVDRKQGLLLRPIEKLLLNPHLLSGWLSINHANFIFNQDNIIWLANPIQILKDTYHYLNMDYRDDLPAAYMIWDHDNDLLNSAVSFYDELSKNLRNPDFTKLTNLLEQDQPAEIFTEEQWLSVQSTNLGYQMGTEILKVIPYLAKLTRFFDLKVNKDLTVNIPESLLQPEFQQEMRKVLAPKPMANSDEIVAESGGMFYPREAPGMDVYIREGEHFNQGDTLYIVEVMKMFSKVHAPFAGRIEKILVQGEGVIIHKGQTLFKVIPDEKIVVENPEEIMQRKISKTRDFLINIKVDL